jgi:SAM-dependent methyltransferase
MAVRPSNRRRSLWTVALLGVGPGDRVLEIGCGPGVALAACAARVRSGLVVGLDHSSLMLAQAARRNRRAIERGRARLALGGLDLLPLLGGPFDKVFSVNVVQFLPDKAAAFRAFHDAMAPGGMLGVTYQPRHRKPTRADALRMAEEIRQCMTAAGFATIGTEELALRSAPAICVLGRRPPARGLQSQGSIPDADKSPPVAIA